MLITEEIRSVVHDPAGKMLYTKRSLVYRFGFEQSWIVSVLRFHFPQIQFDGPVDRAFDVQHAQQSGSLRK